MIKESMSFKDIVLRSGLSDRRARIIRDRFEKFVPFTGEGRRRRYLSGASEVLVLADKLLREGRSDVEIGPLLKSLKVKKQSLPPTEDGLDELRKRLDKLASQVKELKEENKRCRRLVYSLKKRLVGHEKRVFNLESNQFSCSRIWKKIVQFVDEFLDF